MTRPQSSYQFLCWCTRLVERQQRQPERRFGIVEVDDATLAVEGEPPIDERLVLDETSTCVRQVIDSLPEDYRAAVVLHELEGLSAQQTAEICGTSLATAQIRIHRARQRLRQALSQQCGFYRDRDNVLRCDRRP